MRICGSASPRRSMAARPPPTTSGRPLSPTAAQRALRKPQGWAPRGLKPEPRHGFKPTPSKSSERERASDARSKARPRHGTGAPLHLPRNKCRSQPGVLLRRRYVRARPASTERPPGCGRAGEPRRRPSVTAPQVRPPPAGLVPREGREGHCAPPASLSPAARTLRPPLPRGAAQPRPPAALFTSSGRGSSAEQRGQQQQAAGGERHGSAERWGAARSPGCGEAAAPPLVRAPLCVRRAEGSARPRGGGGRGGRRSAALPRSARLFSPPLPSRPPSLLRGAPRAAPKMAAAPPPRRAPLPSGGSEPTARAGGAGEAMWGRGRGGRSPAGRDGDAGAAAGRGSRRWVFCAAEEAAGCPQPSWARTVEKSTAAARVKAPMEPFKYAVSALLAPKK